MNGGQPASQATILGIYAAVVIVVIVASTLLAIDNRLNAQAVAVLSTALGFSGGGAAATSTRRRGTDSNSTNAH